MPGRGGERSRRPWIAANQPGVARCGTGAHAADAANIYWGAAVLLLLLLSLFRARARSLSLARFLPEERPRLRL